MTVLTAPLLAVMGEDHALAKRSLVRLTELAREKLLVVGGGKPSLHGNYLKALLEGRGLKAQHLVEVHGFESLLAMIAGGQGVSILAGRGSIVRVDNVVVRPLKETGPDLELEICAVWREWEPDPDLNPEL